MKEMLFQRSANRLGRPLGINPYPRAFGSSTSANASSPSDIFNEIYRDNYWGSLESRSGVGSESKFASGYRDRLLSLLRARDLLRIFDAPCGDLNWINPLLDVDDIEYLGGDISGDVVKDAQRRHPKANLRVFDITRDEFPQSDVWHCRDCLFHLPFNAIHASLQNFSNSAIKYALITSHRSLLTHKNLDVEYGGFRYLDLELWPVSLPAPLHRVWDFRILKDFPRYVCLWSREQIAAAIARNPY